MHLMFFSEYNFFDCNQKFSAQINEKQAHHDFIKF
jgi:hypothetical protein